MQRSVDWSLSVVEAIGVRECAQSKIDRAMRTFRELGSYGHTLPNWVGSQLRALNTPVLKSLGLSTARSRNSKLSWIA